MHPSAQGAWKQSMRFTSYIREKKPMSRDVAVQSAKNGIAFVEKDGQLIKKIQM
jgi:hypothetical protein